MGAIYYWCTDVRHDVVSLPMFFFTGFEIGFEIGFDGGFDNGLETPIVQIPYCVAFLWKFYF